MSNRFEILWDLNPRLDPSPILDRYWGPVGLFWDLDSRLGINGIILGSILEAGS